VSEVVEFLRGRLDEDEQTARAAFSSQEDPENGWGAERSEVLRSTAIIPHVGVIHEAVQAAHVVRWDPVRVLAEVEAKRRIMVEHQLQPAHTPSPGCAPYGCETCHSHPEFGVGPFGDCTTLKLLALAYAWHEDYREEWRP